MKRPIAIVRTYSTSRRMCSLRVQCLNQALQNFTEQRTQAPLPTSTIPTTKHANYVHAS